MQQLSEMLEFEWNIDVIILNLIIYRSISQTTTLIKRNITVYFAICRMSSAVCSLSTNVVNRITFFPFFLETSPFQDKSFWT
jgi:hypothetical protein